MIWISRGKMMKLLAAYPFSSQSHSLPPIPRPSSFPSATLSNRRGFQLSIRAVNEGKEEQQQEQEEQRKEKGKGRRKPYVSSSDLTVEYVEAMAGAGRGKRSRSRSRSRSRVKRDADPMSFQEKLEPDVKDWESMSFQEKLLEIYVGEKGILFWLNKLAYASIFIVVGGWIAFRFVGPSLGLYQLQSSLLEPTKTFGGGS